MELHIQILCLPRIPIYPSNKNFDKTRCKERCHFLFYLYFRVCTCICIYMYSSKYPILHYFLTSQGNGFLFSFFFFFLFKFNLLQSVTWRIFSNICDSIWRYARYVSINTTSSLSILIHLEGLVVICASISLFRHVPLTVVPKSLDANHSSRCITLQNLSPLLLPWEYEGHGEELH